MFPPEIQTIFDARTVLEAASQNDPRFEQLVEALEKRTGLSRQQVIQNIAQLAQGNIHV